jgi:hypothetical protein
MMSEYDALAEYNTEYILPFNGLYNSQLYVLKRYHIIVMLGVLVNTNKSV